MNPITMNRITLPLFIALLLIWPSVSLAQESTTLKTSKVAATTTVTLTAAQVSVSKNTVRVTLAPGITSAVLFINGKVCPGTVSGGILTVVPPAGVLIVGSNKYSLSYTLPVPITMPLNLAADAPVVIPPVAMEESPTPTNLRITKSVWNTSANKSIDTLEWNPVPGASVYKIYSYNRYLLGTSTTTTFTVTLDKSYPGTTYSVSAVVGGMESNPSALSMYGQPPESMGSWTGNTVEASSNLTNDVLWDGPTKPINILTWTNGTGLLFNVYRDGILLCPGISRLYYIDAAVLPSHTYRYEIEAQGLLNAAVTLGPKVASTVTIPPAAPPFYRWSAALPGISGIKIKANDDSAMVIIPAVASVQGAKDYRAYVKGTRSYKYAGSPLSDKTGTMLDVGIEVNNLDPANVPVTLVVEALDRQGPFQLMDGTMPIGHMDGMGTHTNGQGDPSFRPVVLARSEVVVSALIPFKLTGTQQFLDTFRGDPTITPNPANPVAPRVFEYTTDKWLLKTWEADHQNTALFIMNKHFMDTLLDGDDAGPAKGQGGPHNNISTVTMEPRTAIADISGGKTLHVFMEVDAMFGGRRWCDIVLRRADDVIVNPAFQKLEAPLAETKSGDVLIWEIIGDVHALTMTVGDGTNTGKYARRQFQISTYTNDPLLGVGRESFVSRQEENDLSPFDKRVRFDLYVSETMFALVSGGKVLVSRPFTEKLPFTRITPVYTHHVYHTGNDEDEQRKYNQFRGAYYYNHRPWADERHWDSMGFEVLDAFPFGLVNPLAKK